VIARIRRYVEESYSELKKVTWPTREQVRNLTVLVFAISATVGIFIAAVDFGFTEVVRFLNDVTG
jgi:preprotein translocase subunit SecE